MSEASKDDYARYALNLLDILMMVLDPSVRAKYGLLKAQIETMVAEGRDPTPEEWDALNAETTGLSGQLQAIALKLPPPSPKPESLPEPVPNLEDKEEEPVKDPEKKATRVALPPEERKRLKEARRTKKRADRLAAQAARRANREKRRKQTT